MTRLEVVWFYVASTLTAVVLAFGDMGLPEVLILVGLFAGLACEVSWRRWHGVARRQRSSTQHR